MLSTITLIAISFALCVVISPFLAVLWLVHKWSKWVNGMVNGSGSNDNGKEILKLLGKLLSK